eukprot:TRINITY_DN4605_c0_g1_i1.p1 TRINITY_DN4605_c0_g1~~TRINITY_DN4605_c0_g1_i1.p1  ORF type:complete len:554 (+),score=64.43 TRINITY_DN4605_c0_g1_i1:46-1707(+)
MNRFALCILLLPALVLGFPDSGKWTYLNLKDISYIGTVKSVYENTSMTIHLECQEDFTIEFGWMLRKSPCWEEYNIYSRSYENYFNHPDERGVNYKDLGDEYKVHFAKPPIQTLNCNERVSIPQFSEDTASPAAQAAAAMSGNSAVNNGGDGGRKRREVRLSSSNKPQYLIRHEGLYLLVLFIQPKMLKDDLDVPTFNANVSVEFKSPTGGYLSLTDWPLLPFYGLMCGLYVILGLLWLIFCSIYWRDLLRLQFWIGGVIFLGMVEKAIFTIEYENINNNGRATQGLIICAEIISCAKRTLARMLVLIVSLGYGIVKPRLGQTLNHIVFIGLVYFVLASIESVTRNLNPKLDPSNITLIADVPLAVLDASLCWWIFSSLIQTTRSLRLRRNLVKLSVYKHFTNTMAFAVVSSIIFMMWSIYNHRLNTECMTDWKDLWVDEAFWHLLFSVILLVIMILWRPSQNNQRYAFTQLLDGDDGYSSDEDILYNDSWEGLKLRSKGGSRPDSPMSDTNPEEDPLKWIEENIPGVDMAPLPALDSEEELETTKLEISKLM